MQDWAWGIQLPAHSLVPVGQLPPQEAPSHVAVPPAGMGHGTQELPQLAVLILEAQAVPQAWVPAPQVNPQLVPLQVAVLPAGAAHAVHEVAPQLAVLALDTQVVPHR